MIKEFNRATCKAIGLELEEAAKAIAAKHGLVAIPTGGSFDPVSFTAKVKFSLAASNPNTADAEREQFAMLCGGYGMDASHYGSTYNSHEHGPLTLIGFDPGRPKYAVKVRTAKGDVRLFSTLILNRFRTPVNA